jgi:hypothetical protein
MILLPRDKEKPKTLAKAMEALWGILYSSEPYMNKVSFDQSFIAIYKENETKFESQKWQPTVHGFPNALQEEAIRRGSQNTSNTHRVLENKVTPMDVVKRDKEIKYMDFLIVTGTDHKNPFPDMYRYYYDPQGGKWLKAFSASFYNKKAASRKMFD